MDYMWPYLKWVILQAIFGVIRGDDLFLMVDEITGV